MPTTQYSAKRLSRGPMMANGRASHPPDAGSRFRSQRFSSSTRTDSCARRSIWTSRLCLRRWVFFPLWANQRVTMSHAVENAIDLSCTFAADQGPLASDVATGATVVLRQRDVEALAHDPRLEGVGLAFFDLMGITDGCL